MIPPPLFKLYKKTGKMVWGGFPYSDNKKAGHEVKLRLWLKSGYFSLLIATHWCSFVTHEE